MSDGLDVLRAPVPVGGALSAAVDRPAPAHPAFEARSVLTLAAPSPVARPEPRPRPPDPLGVLDGGEPHDPVLSAAEPAPSRRGVVLVAVVAIVALVAGGLVVMAGNRADEGAARGDDVMVAPTAISTTPLITGIVMAGEVAWGPDPGVCPDDEPACYTVAVELVEFEPGRQLAVECVVGDRLGPGPRTVTIGPEGAARTRVPCAGDRSARSIDITVDGAVAAVVELPTTIVPRPTVTFTAERSAQGQPSCSSPSCRYLDVVLTGFEPGTEVDVSCHSSSVSSFSTGTVTIGPDGTATNGRCYFGGAGEEVWVEAGDVRSETITWPG